MCAKPRKARKKTEGFTPDERLSRGGLAPDPGGGEPPAAASKPATGIEPALAPAEAPPPGCPRREVCVNADADPAYCLAMTEACGGFRRIGAPNPAPRPTKHMDGNQETIIGGAGLPVFRLSYSERSEMMSEAARSREDRGAGSRTTTTVGGFLRYDRNRE
jgi:hypothetical protein